MNLLIDRRKLMAAAGGLVLFSGVTRYGRAWAAPKLAGYPFTLGVASGDPWPDGFVIWTRLALEPLGEHGGMPMAVVPVRWEVSEDERFDRIVRSGEALARPELGHSVHVEVDGLLPHRHYWYRFFIEGAEASPTGMVRTAPAAGDLPDRIRLAVAGCQHFAGGWFSAWRHLGREPDLDAVFHYGDYIYDHPAGPRSDKIRDAGGKVVDRRHLGGETYSLDDYRRRYAQYKTDPDLQAAHLVAAFITSFDDHEIENDWASVYDQNGTAPEIFALRRFSAMQAWYENMPVRKAQFPRPDGLTMYRRLDFGRLFRMHVLDTRSYRDDQLCSKVNQKNCRAVDSAEATILGANQEAWLSRGLSNDGRWNLLAQQVFVMPLGANKPNGAIVRNSLDKWDGYPAARARLIKAITERKLTNVVVASGDAHLHAVGRVPLRDDELDGPAAATEFLGSSITSGGDGAPTIAGDEQRMANNPHLALLNHQRGYLSFDIGPKEWHTDVKVIDRVTIPEGKLSRLARFVVTPDKAELHKA